MPSRWIGTAQISVSIRWTTAKQVITPASSRLTRQCGVVASTFTQAVL